MRSEEARVGMRVRVSTSPLTADLGGTEGTITARWGDPTYVALDVLLEDGSRELFWHHELEEIYDGPGRSLYSKQIRRA